jgi:hypothetical protein
MSITARVTPVWKKQKLFLALLLLAFGGFFFLDGAITWPRSNERYRRYHEFADRNDSAGWTRYAQEHHWDVKPPEKLYTDAALRGQFYFGSVCTALGIIALAYWWRQLGRTIRLDDEAVFSPGGERIPFSAITGLGLKQWDAKGLARVRYDVGGRSSEFTIDDYKYDAESSKAIVEELKRRLEAAAKQ